MNKQKIKGTLYGVAIGDALGSITEFSTYKQIKDAFNNELFTFEEQISFVSKGEPIGTVTDDFSSCYFVMKKLIENDMIFDKNTAIEIIEEWTSCGYYFEKFAGQTSKKALELVKKGEIENFGKCINFLGQTSNGGAMKVAPLAILANGDLEKAIKYAIDMCYPTHYNSLAVAGACAVSCAICQSQKDDTNIDEIIEAGIYGAKKGQEYMENIGRIAIGPKLFYCIEHAVDVAKKCDNYDDLLLELDQKIGTNIQVTECIATVFGIIKGVDGDTKQGIKAGVNIGGDTDTIASIVGAILGGYNGFDSLPIDLLDVILEKNKALEIEKIIEKFNNMILLKSR